MKVILDECLPRRLLRDLPDHMVTSVAKQGWAGITNGALLKCVTPEFDVFITMDSNVVHQQNMDGLEICLIFLHSQNSRYETLQPLLPQIREALTQAKAGSVIHIGG
jgi:hypothetical protein